MRSHQSISHAPLVPIVFVRIVHKITVAVPGLVQRLVCNVTWFAIVVFVVPDCLGVSCSGMAVVDDMLVNR